MAYDLKRNRGKVSEIRQNIESKKSELAQLEAQSRNYLMRSWMYKAQNLMIR